MEEPENRVTILHPDEKGIKLEIARDQESWDRPKSGGWPLGKKRNWNQENREKIWQIKRRWLEQNIPVCPECGDRCSVCKSLKNSRHFGCCLR